MVEFRDATPADAHAIATVVVASWRVAYRGQLPDELLDELSVADREQIWSQILTEAAPRSGALLAVSDGAVIGFAAWGPANGSPDPALGELYAIYLDPAYWGIGVGRRLHAAAIDRLRAQGFTGAVLWVLDGNVRAERFYRLAGWTDTGRTKVDRIGAEDRLERQLSHPLTPARNPSRTMLPRM